MPDQPNARERASYFDETFVHPSRYAPRPYAYQKSTAHLPAQPQAVPQSPYEPDEALRQAISRLGKPKGCAATHG